MSFWFRAFVCPSSPRNPKWRAKWTSDSDFFLKNSRVRWLIHRKSLINEDLQKDTEARKDLKKDLKEQMDQQSIQLLARWQDGDEQAADEIFQRYLQRLIAMARQRISEKLQRRIDAEDVVQSAYRSFFRQAKKDDRYVLEKSGDLWRLLAGITIKKLKGQIEFHQAKKRSIGNEGSILMAGNSARLHPAAVARDPSIEEALALTEELEQLLSDIDPIHREILELRLQGQDIEEIAETVDRSQRTVRRVLRDVTNNLSERLNSES